MCIAPLKATFVTYDKQFPHDNANAAEVSGRIELLRRFYSYPFANVVITYVFTTW